MNADQFKARVKDLRQTAIEQGRDIDNCVACLSFESYVQVAFRDPVDSFMGPPGMVCGIPIKPSADLRGDEVELRWVLK